MNIRRNYSEKIELKINGISRLIGVFNKNKVITSALACSMNGIVTQRQSQWGAIPRWEYIESFALLFVTLQNSLQVNLSNAKPAFILIIKARNARVQFRPFKKSASKVKKAREKLLNYF